MRNTTEPLSTDEELVDLCEAGDTSCLGILYKRYYKKVYHKCLSYTKNPDLAYDLAQDILLKAFGKISSFRRNSKFSTWLFAITSNHCIAYLRKTKNIYFEDIDSYFNIEEEYPDFEERILYEQKELHLTSQLSEISEIERNMLVLKYQDNYSITDLQKEFNMNASAVKMRLLRAKHKMEEKLNNIQLPSSAG